MPLSELDISRLHFAQLLGLLQALHGLPNSIYFLLYFADWIQQHCGLKKLGREQEVKIFWQTELCKYLTEKIVEFCPWIPWNGVFTPDSVFLAENFLMGYNLAGRGVVIGLCPVAYPNIWAIRELWKNLLLVRKFTSI